MKAYSERRIFTTLMTLLATSFAVSIVGPKLGPQVDLLEDTLKIGGLVAVFTALISFSAWTLTHWKGRGLIRGAIAGAITALLIVPLPAAAWTFKTSLVSAYPDVGLIRAVFSAIIPTISSGLYTFVDITKASLIAFIGSCCLGAAVSYYVAAKTSRPS